MVDSEKSIIRIIVLVVIAITLTIILASLALAKRDASIYPSNVSVGGIKMTGLSRGEAEDILAERLPISYSQELQLKLPSRTLFIPFNEIGISYDIPATLDLIDSSLHQKGLNGILQHSIFRGTSHNLVPQLSWNQGMLQKKLYDSKKLYDQPAINARILYNKDYFEYISHKNGYVINVSASLDKIENSLQKGLSGPVSLVVSEIYPRVKLEDVKQVRDMLGVSICRIESSEAISGNLVIALNGSLIMPGESFALIEVIKPIETGTCGLTLINNILDQVCSQAGIKVISTPVKFVNNLEHPILIIANIEGNNLIIKLFGNQTIKGKKIGIVKEKEEIAPGMQVKVRADLSPQQRIILQEGQNGYINRTYRVVKINNQVMEKTLLSEDLIPERDTIIAVGPGTIEK